MKASCKCGATWTGMKVEHCTSCHESFSGTTSGDAHRTGRHDQSSGPNRRRCLTRDEMLAKGLEPRENSHGTEIWGRAGSQEGSFWLTQHDSESLRTPDWVDVRLAGFEALENEESA